jgi:hypothetical protein
MVYMGFLLPFLPASLLCTPQPEQPWILLIEALQLLPTVLLYKLKILTTAHKDLPLLAS